MPGYEVTVKITFSWNMMSFVLVKNGESKCNNVQAWADPEDSRRLRLPEFLGNRHMKVVRLSALRTGRLYTPGSIPGTNFC